MKHGRHHIIPLLSAILFITGTTSAMGQSPFDPKYAGEAARIRECVEVLTDRSLYAVNEEIRFMASTRSAGVTGRDGWSTVLYVELVDAAGEAVASGKFPIRRDTSRGSLRIPGTCLTGNYFLKCYTRWMRNSGPGAYSYTQLKIINPFRKELSAGVNGDQPGKTAPAGEYIKGRLSCRADARVYHRGEEVRLILESPGLYNDQEISCCLTVAPVDAIDTTGRHAGGGSEEFDPAGFRVDFLPDLRGPSISGSLVIPGEGSGTGYPVRFTIMGEQPDHLAVFTDPSGRFIFSPPVAHGPRELFVTPGPEAGEGAEVRIDLDFDIRPVPWRTEEFILTDGERDAATGIALRTQLRDAFRIGREAASMTLPADTVPFYGTPVHRIRLDEFIDLPTLEEVFINLVPDVNVIRRRGEKMLRLEGENSSIEIYDPLVMIDFIPVFDQAAMLKVDPGRIARIDVIDQVYIRGNISYGGVVNIISRKGDLAGIDLPDGSYFFDFQSIEPQVEPGVPIPHGTTGSGGERLPDTRNTLLWKDHLVIGKGEEKEISFPAPGYPGEFVVFLRWIAAPGEIHAAVTRFNVR